MNKYLQMLEDGTDPKVVILEMQKEIDKDEATDTYICTDFNLSLNDMKMRKQSAIQPPNGDIFTIKIFKR